MQGMPQLISQPHHPHQYQQPHPQTQQQQPGLIGVPQHVMPNNGVVWTGVSNGEVLWSLPQQGNPDSPSNSDGGSIMNARMATDFIENIDWVSHLP